MSGPSANAYRTRYLKLRAALYDRTTALPTWPVLLDTLRSLLEQRRSVGVLHLEVANLEAVESLYGWHVFDGIVARVAAVLRAAVGQELPSDALLALGRLAGSSFVIFVPHEVDGRAVDDAGLTRMAAALARRVDAALAGPDLEALGPPLVARAGHARLAFDAFHRFERRVQAAIEEAQGGDARRERQRELSWSEQLRGIIRAGSVETVFQPVVELDSRRVIGHEAFVRGPRDSMFETPRTMFDLSQRVGVAAELDRLCCEAALARGSELSGRGMIFLNVLPATLAAGDWCGDRLPALLDTLDLRPENLVLELSERAAQAEAQTFLGFVRRCQASGFRVALDDVGTGSVGREAIERARPHYLKLDPSLVRGIGKHALRLEVAADLVALARSIEAEVIAEGVESASEADALRSAGALYGQGFYYAAPSASGALPPPQTES